jgi:lysozyme
MTCTLGLVGLALAAEMLIRDEGIKYEAYRDTEGHWTIGVGHKVEGGRLSHDTVMMMLDDDIHDHLESACKVVGQDWFESLSVCRKLAILNLTFNLGETGFAEFKKTISLMKQDRWQDAANNLLKQKYAKQVKSRAHRVAALLQNDPSGYPGVFP